MLGSLARNRPIVVLLDQALVSGSTFLTLVLLGRFCGATALGSYVLAFSVLVLAGMVQAVLLTDPVVYSIRARKGIGHTDGVVLKTLWLALASVTVLVIALVVRFLPGLENLAPVLVLIAPIWMAREFARRFAMANERFEWVLVMDFCIALLHLSGLALLLGWGRLDAATALAALGLANGAVVLAFSVRGLPRLSGKGRSLGTVAREHWAMGRWLLAESGADYVDQYALHWLLLATYGADATGLLAACLLPVAIASPILQSAGNYLGPAVTRALAEGGLAGMKRQVRLAGVGLGIAGLGLTALAGLGGPYVVQILFPDMAVAENALLIALAAFTIFWLCLEEVPAHALRALGQARLDLMATVVGVCVTVVAGLGLVWSAGLAGVILAMVVGGVSSTAARWTGLWLALERHPRPAASRRLRQLRRHARALAGQPDRATRPASVGRSQGGVGWSAGDVGRSAGEVGRSAGDVGRSARSAP